MKGELLAGRAALDEFDRLRGGHDVSIDLNKLHPSALAAAMRGGTDGWGQVSSAADHVRYAAPVRPASRRRCYCGCNARATHLGMANGIGLTTACALGIARWVKTGDVRATANVKMQKNP